MNQASKATGSRAKVAAGDVIDALARLGAVHDYPKNVVIITEGDRSDSVYVVLAGRVQVYMRGARGRKVVLGAYGPGEYVGEMELDGQARCASVMTLEPCRLSLLTAGQFRDYMSRVTSSWQLIEVLVSRARRSTDTIRALALMGAYERVTRLLAALAVERNGSRAIEHNVTQQDIADQTACSREMVSRILKKLHECGYIQLEKRRIRLLRPLSDER